MSSESLLELARSRVPADRERLLVGIVDLCQANDPAKVAANTQIQALLNSIFLGLVVGAERDIRRRLSNTLASADWCPSALVNVLALDEIEIARPIIARSSVLQDADLVRLLVEATIEHQIEVARRPNLSAGVAAAIVRKAEPAVMTALAGNVTADVAEADMLRLVESARQNTTLRAPLSTHPKLTGDLALRLYIWVGQTLRDELAERFRLDPTLMMMALAQAVAEAHGASPDGRVVSARRLRVDAGQQPHQGFRPHGPVDRPPWNRCVAAGGPAHHPARGAQCLDERRFHWDSLLGGVGLRQPDRAGLWKPEFARPPPTLPRGQC